MASSPYRTHAAFGQRAQEDIPIPDDNPGRRRHHKQPPREISTIRRAAEPREARTSNRMRRDLTLLEGTLDVNVSSQVEHLGFASSTARFERRRAPNPTSLPTQKHLTDPMGVCY
jgi:hypothetical protein